MRSSGLLYETPDAERVEPDEEYLRKRKVAGTCQLLALLFRSPNYRAVIFVRCTREFFAMIRRRSENIREYFDVGCRYRGVSVREVSLFLCSWGVQPIPEI